MTTRPRSRDSRAIGVPIQEAAKALVVTISGRQQNLPNDVGKFRYAAV